MIGTRRRVQGERNEASSIAAAQRHEEIRYTLAIYTAKDA